MKRLAPPIRAIREPFGTAGLIVACVALIAALAGGAYAASGLNGKQKKEVKRIAQTEAKKLQGSGPQGPAGAQGAAGGSGKDGSAGTAGASGKSVVLGTAPSGKGAGKCADGGITVEVEGAPASKQAVCNGEEGEPGAEGPRGEEGSPWTNLGVLPAGQTETGTWGGGFKQGVAIMPISFTLPLTAAPTATFLKPSQTTTACPGLVSGVPKAQPGNLCLYAGTFTGTFPLPGEEGAPGFFDPTAEFTPGTNKSGAIFLYACGSLECNTFGTWAVTAPLVP